MRGVVAQQGYGVKVGRQRTDLRHFLRRPDQEVLALAIQPAQRPDNIAGVSANAELSHPPDVDGDSHGEI